MQKKEGVNQDTTTRHEKPVQQACRLEEEPWGHKKARGSELSTGLPSAHSGTCMPPPKGVGMGTSEAKTNTGEAQ